ncbi:hypothetical protein CDAR_39961 [Caerostris darwini]|uniref:Uncharacterized protein n=1 Tax=Caerostris darwini TaxID=1538125 RepID=A0AAV4MKH5_9ARAC|nr:hypothetical protein CDAR_39961 [Caerostris darwini]
MSLKRPCRGWLVARMHEGADDVLLKNKQTMSVVSQEEKFLKKIPHVLKAKSPILQPRSSDGYRLPGPPPTVFSPTK